MKKIRTCAGTHINSGSSACKIDWSKVKGAILVEPGTKLPDDVTAEKLAEMCHADRPGRIYPISPFFEYAKNGGEAQISAVGYGPNQFNGLNAQTDTFTLAGCLQYPCGRNLLSLLIWRHLPGIGLQLDKQWTSEYLQVSLYRHYTR